MKTVFDILNYQHHGWKLEDGKILRLWFGHLRLRLSSTDFDWSIGQIVFSINIYPSILASIHAMLIPRRSFLKVLRQIMSGRPLLLLPPNDVQLKLNAALARRVGRTKDVLC